MEFNSLIPELSVSNFDKSLHFYVNMIGFAVSYDRPDDKFAFLTLEGAQLMIEQLSSEWETGPLERPYGRGINFQIEVTDLQPILKRLNGANYSLFREPRDAWYRVEDQLEGQREFLVMDPDGYLLRFCQFLGTQPVTK